MMRGINALMNIRLCATGVLTGSSSCTCQSPRTSLLPCLAACRRGSKAWTRNEARELAQRVSHAYLFGDICDGRTVSFEADGWSAGQRVLVLRATVDADLAACFVRAVEVRTTCAAHRRYAIP